ncbi:glycosyl transferase [Acinetobacter sp. TGL-Y2]|nr:glycosyl transferase [Acinetobacter sp. TGL-Y2]
MRVMDTALSRQRRLFENNRFHFKRQNHADSEVQVVEGLVRARLKIAIVTETWPPELNGVALSLLQICKGLQRLGHKILLIRPDQKQKCLDFAPNKECLVTGQVIPKYTQMQFGWPQYRKVSKAFDEFMPDIVHVVTEGPLGLAVLQSAKSKNIPISSGFHSAFQDFSRFYDLAFLVKPIQHYLKWFHNNTQLTCVPSQDTAQAILDFGVTCPIEVIKTGVDVEKFSPVFKSSAQRRKWGACENTTVMLYVGRISPEKEIQLLIDTYISMRREPERKLKLVIVGEGPDRVRLEKYSQTAGVIFTGSLTGNVLAEVFASADVFVFASQVETFGNVILEAMASALPVVAYDYAAAKLHLDANTAWLCPLGQKQNFIQNMQQLPNNKTLHAMGQQAMKNVQSVGWNHCVQQLEQAFYRVVQETEITA